MPLSGSASTGERICRLLHPGAGGAGDDVGHAAGVAVMGVDLAAVAHGRGQGQRLAAAAAAEVENLLALDVAGAGGGQLRAEVLDLEPALAEGRDGLDRAAAFGGGRRGDAEGVGQQTSRNRVERRQGLGGPLGVGFETVGAQVDGRPFGQLRAFLGPGFAEHPRQVEIDPVGIIAGHGGRSALRAARGEGRQFGIGQRADAVLLVGGGFRDPLDRPVPDEAEHGQSRGPGAVIAHGPAERPPLSQPVQHQSGDEGAVLGAGVTGGFSPALERHPRGPMPGFDVRQDFNRRR